MAWSSDMGLHAPCMIIKGPFRFSTFGHANPCPAAAFRVTLRTIWTENHLHEKTCLLPQFQGCGLALRRYWPLPVSRRLHRPQIRALEAAGLALPHTLTPSDHRRSRLAVTVSLYITSQLPHKLAEPFEIRYPNCGHSPTTSLHRRV